MGDRSVAASFAAGLLANLMAISNICIKDQWIDLLSLIITTLGIIFGFYTYFSWTSSKKRDDGYGCARRYRAVISEIEDSLSESLNHYSQLIPFPGVTIKHNDEIQFRLKRLYDINESIALSIRILSKSSRELEAYNISMKNDLKVNHDSIKRESFNICIIGNALNSQLKACNKNPETTYDAAISLYKQFFEISQILTKRIDSILATDMASIFNFRHI